MYVIQYADSKYWQCGHLGPTKGQTHLTIIKFYLSLADILK